MLFIVFDSHGSFIVMADVGMSFVIIVGPSGKTRKQLAHAHFGLRLIFGMMGTETST